MMKNNYEPRAEGELLIEQTDGDYVVYDRITEKAHALKELHYRVLTFSKKTFTNEDLSELFPNQLAEDAWAKLASIQQMLSNEGLLVEASSSGISRRSFVQKAAAVAVAVPAIMTVAAPQPASAASLGTYTFNTVGTTNQSVDPGSLTFFYQSIGGGGGGGGAGGDGGGTAVASAGGAGSHGNTKTGSATLGGATSINVVVGDGGQPGDSGNAGGTGGLRGSSNILNGTTGGNGGPGADGSNGDNGGGGGGSGGTSGVIGFPAANATGGRGGGGGGGAQIGSVTSGSPGSDGSAGGTGGAPNGTGGTGGNGGNGFTIATGTGPGAGGSAGAAGTKGQVTISFFS